SRNQRKASKLRSPPPISSSPGAGLPGVGSAGSPTRWRCSPDADTAPAHSSHSIATHVTIPTTPRLPIAFLLPVAGTVHSDERRRDFPRPMRRRPTIVYRAAMPTALDQWFTEQILVHEEALSRYLARNCSRRDEIHDLRQEIYVRVYEAAARSLPDRPGPFLFASARHLLADRAR